MGYTYSVIITTHNRKNYLSQTCSELRRLSGQLEEVIVTLDGCDDGSEEAVRETIPNVRLIVNANRVGSIPARDRMMRMARGQIVISLDDDSYPAQPDFLAKLEQVLAERPEAAVIAFRELRDGQADAASPPEEGRWVSWFSNCGAAYRRNLYGQLLAFPPHFEHAYEEPDYALQAYAAGYGVWREPSLVVRHHFAPSDRSYQRRHAFQARNETLSVLMRCPLAMLPFILGLRWIRQAMYSTRAGFSWLTGEPLRWARLWPALRESLRLRSPVGYRSYWLWFRMNRRPVADPRQFCAGQRPSILRSDA
jgi:GT2 family glycosyltransferase